MGRFVDHEPCPDCGSRDNLGRWDDGSAWCFGCGYHELADKRARRIEKLTTNDDSTPKLPDDTGTAYSKEAVDWLAQYHVTVEKAISSGIRWSEAKQQLIFLLEDGCWQARNFRPNSKKYFTAGNVNDSIKIYLHVQNYNKSRRLLAVVEDCVSAIRIAGCQTDAKACSLDALPVLGSHVANLKLNRIARLYSSLIVWLDHDKLKEARSIARKASMLGMDTRVIYTDLDPKCYTNEQILEYLK